MTEFDFEKAQQNFDRRLKGFGGQIGVLVYLRGCESQLLDFLRETSSTKMAYEVVGVPLLHKDGFGIQGGSNMTGTDLYVNKPHCAAAVRP